jgi:hypothetical protein
MPLFTFQPQWKEELVCTGPGGSFILELPMGDFSAYLPTEETWKLKAPPWARELWPTLRAELEVWCKANNCKFFLDASAHVCTITSSGA